MEPPAASSAQPRRGLSSRRYRGFHAEPLSTDEARPSVGLYPARASEANALLVMYLSACESVAERTARSCRAFPTPLIGTAVQERSAGVLGSVGGGVFGRANTTRCFTWIPRSGA